MLLLQQEKTTVLICVTDQECVEVGVELIIEQKAILDIFFATDHILGLQ